MYTLHARNIRCSEAQLNYEKKASSHSHTSEPSVAFDAKGPLAASHGNKQESLLLTLEEDVYNVKHAAAISAAAINEMCST